MTRPWIGVSRLISPWAKERSSKGALSESKKDTLSAKRVHRPHLVAYAFVRWDDGLRGMCIGETRKLTIPSGLAYGDDGSGEKIPGGSTLQFDVDLLDIKRHQKAKPKGNKKRKGKKGKKKAAKDEV